MALKFGNIFDVLGLQVHFFFFLDSLVFQLLVDDYFYFKQQYLN